MKKLLRFLWNPNDRQQAFGARFGTDPTTLERYQNEQRERDEWRVEYDAWLERVQGDSNQDKSPD